MKPQDTAIAVSLTATGALACVLGLLLGLGEVRPFLEGGASRAERYQWVEQGDLQPAASIYANNLSVKACLDAAGSVHGMMQPDSRRQTVTANCTRLTGRILQTTPVNAYAAYAAAKFAALEGRAADFNRYLQQSRIVAPFAQWIAEPRVQLAEEYRDMLNEPGQAALQADIGLLLQSNRGVRSIARRYVQQPEFRERVLQIAETLPDGEQRRFLNNVRRAARDMGLL